MVRISGARMSGTAYGSIILHMTPDAAAGGPLARVRNGDCICLSVKERRPLSLPPQPARGYARLYHDQILQADRGCDFDFLRKRPTEKAGL